VKVMRIKDKLRVIFNWLRRFKSRRLRSSPSLQQQMELKRHREDIEFPSVQEEKPQCYVFVGVDYGTSGTKVMWKASRVKKNIHIVEFPEYGLPFYQNLIVPSLVSVDSGRLYFGNIEDKKKEYKFFVSLKKWMGYEAGLLENVGKLPSWEIEGISRSTYSLSPWGLSALFLGFVLQQTEKAVKNEIGKDFSLKIYYTFGIPYHFFDNPKCKDLFERAFFVAHYVKGNVYQGITDKEAFELLNEGRRTYNSTSPEERVTLVAPETQVSVLSQIWSPTHPDGLHAVVDIGAGTTDITFFYVARPFGEVPRITIYATRAFGIGIDDLDRGLLGEISKREKVNYLTSSEREILLLQLRETRPRIRKGKEVYLFGEKGHKKLVFSILNTKRCWNGL